MTKYYKSGETGYLIINKNKVIHIDVFDEKHIEVNYVEHFDDVYDYTELKEISSLIPTNILNEFNKKCQDVIVSGRFLNQN